MDPESISFDLNSPLLPSKDSSVEKRLSVDEVLSQYAGEFGPWQLRNFVLVSLVWCCYAMHTMVVIFADREPTWRCTDQVTATCTTGSLDDVCKLEPGSWEWVGGSRASTVAQWGLVCGQRFKVGLAQSAYFAGSMIGCGIFGHLSDASLGRKGSLTILCIMGAIFGTLTAASPTYIVYVTLRLLTGLSSGAMGPCSFVLATETIGTSYRAIAGMCTFYFFSIGVVMLSLIAYFTTSWRVLYVVTSLPTLLFFVAALPFIPESPRWCLIHQKPNKAMEIINSITKKNGRECMDKVLLVLDGESSNEHHTKSSTIVDAFRSPITRSRLVLAVIISFLCSITYYGLNLNVGNLGTNLYISAAANAIADIPAYALSILFLNWFGRKPLTVGTMWLSGAFCVVGIFMNDEGFARLVCRVMGLFGMAAAFNLLMVYVAELFPTAVRNAALGSAQQAIQMAAIFAPFVVVTGGQIAFSVFAVCGVASGILTFYLPETLNKPLYDTMAGIEEGEKMQRS